jgi:hypothetical protein
MLIAYQRWNGARSIHQKCNTSDKKRGVMGGSMFSSSGNVRGSVRRSRLPVDSGILQFPLLLPNSLQTPNNLYCNIEYFHTQYSKLVQASCPSGFVLDINTSGGCSPVNGAMPGKLIGGGSCNCGAPDGLGNAFGGEPININSGNMFYSATDYKTAGQNTLDFTRYYNSRGNALAELGANWRSTYDRVIWFYSSSSVGVQRADGQTLIFTLNGTTWNPDSDVAYALANSGSTWTLTTPNDTVETYTNSSTINAALLNIIQARNGYTQTLTYNASNQLASVTDSYGRTLTFTPMQLVVCCRRLALLTPGRSPTVIPRQPAAKISPQSLIQAPRPPAIFMSTKTPI